MLQTPNMSQLLPELLETILEQLDEDNPSLLACSLVSKSHWLDSSRHVLFRKLTIDGRKRAFSAIGFAEYLKSTPDVAKHVRELSLAELKLVSRGRIQPPLQFNTLATILKSLPSLETLDLENVMWESTDRATSVPVDFSAHLKTLSLSRVVFLQDPPKSLLDILQLFSHLDHLVLGGIWAESSHNAPLGLPVPVPDAAKLKVNSLTLLDSKCNGAMLKFIRQTFALPPLQELDVVCSQMRDVDKLQVFIREAGRYLKALRLDLSQVHVGDDNPSQWNIINLSPCTLLRSLSFHIFMSSRQRTPGRWSWRSATDVLSTANSIPLQHVSFGLEMVNFRRAVHGFDYVDWSRLETILGRFVSLTAVTFCQLSRGCGRASRARYQFHAGPRDFLEPRLSHLQSKEILKWTMSRQLLGAQSTSKRREPNMVNASVAPNSLSGHIRSV